MLKAYRYKLEPNKSQRYALARALGVCRELCNICLYQRKLQQISRYERERSSAVRSPGISALQGGEVQPFTRCIICSG